MRPDPYGPPSDQELLVDLENAAEQLRSAGTTEAELRKHLETILGRRLPRGPIEALRDRVEAIVAGRHSSIATPWPELTRLALPLLPGSLVILGGGVGSSKSFAICQMMTFWLENGINAVALTLEGNLTFHLHRALAQIAEVASVTDPAWAKFNGDRMRELLELHGPVLERLANHWFVASALNIDSQDHVMIWAEKQARGGKRIVAVDPITMLNRGSSRPWDCDARFIKSLKRTAETFGITILLVTHPGKGVTDPMRENLAGGAAYERFCDTLLVLQSHDPKRSRVLTPCGTVEIEHNRTLRIEKARHGSGTGLRLAMRFSGETLLMAEQGIILKAKKGRNCDE